jgi:hypothetical protein
LLFLLLIIGCAVPHPALERPEAHPGAAPVELLPPGQRTPFFFMGSKAGTWSVLRDGGRMAALRFDSPSQAMNALKEIKRRQDQESSSRRRSATIGNRGYLAYEMGNRHGLAWTSGVWVFIAEAPSPEALNRLVADSPAGGMGAGADQGGFPKLPLLIIAGIALCALVFIWVLVKGVSRRMTVQPLPGVSPISGLELRERLLALNSPDRPFVVREGEESDLVAEWKIVDSSWWGLFSKAGLKKTYRLFLALDADRREVRAFEEESSVEWQGGAPAVSYSVEKFRGLNLFRYERGVGYGLKEGTLEPGKVYDYRFDVREIKGPVIETVTAGGWRFAPVLLKRKVRRGPLS